MNTISFLRNSLESVLSALVRNRGVAIDSLGETRYRQLRAVAEFQKPNGDTVVVAVWPGVRCNLHPVVLEEDGIPYDYPTISRWGMPDYFSAGFNPERPNDNFVSDGQIIRVFAWTGNSFVNVFTIEETEAVAA